MFFNRLKNSDETQVNIRKVNEVVTLSKKVLGVLYVILIAIGVFLATKIFQEWKIFDFLLTVLGILSPLFIGLFIAWLLTPIVKWLQKKGIKKIWAVVMTYVVLLGILSILLGSIIPLLSNQINDFASSIPAIFDIIEEWSNNLFRGLENIKSLDVESIKTDFYKGINNFGTDLTTSLPAMTVGLVKGIFASITNIVVGLIIGFYILVSFDGPSALITLLPKGMQKTTTELITKVEESLRSFIQGALFDSTFVFLISSVSLWLVGLKAPLLFGLFCGITNMIPYAGPYIGGFPAVIVAFSQNPTTGLFTLIIIAIIQMLEGNFIQPLIMSKTTNLHPVTIMIGLLIFGHFWGIIGMFISTPVIAATKAILTFFNDKYEIIKFSE